MSPHHLQRRFKAIVGLSPREYQAAVRADRLRASLRDGRDVTTAIYEAGYGSPSRVYEAAPTGKGMSLSAYRRHGEGMRIGYSIVPSPIGRVLVAATETRRVLGEDRRRAMWPSSAICTANTRRRTISANDRAALANG